MSSTGVFVTIGSNLEPERNIPAIISALLGHSLRLVVSPLIYTDPYGFESDNTFINGVVFIESDLDKAVLKEHFNLIENRLGRDRTAPNSKLRDRPADIDILCSWAELEERGIDACMPWEPYLKPIFRELLRALRIDGEGEKLIHPRIVELSLEGALFGKATAAIDRDGGTCHVVVIE